MVELGGQSPSPGTQCFLTVHNYIGITDDACVDEFTPGQGARMDNMALMYR
ncbi:hypothetical protein JY651_23425 [Pyxidicoccus parkwayensis]|uniref:Uncharacterized protein n=1 Tax=Pyxidicoccus parkwayensis TaxID=2813578 RepID=A0ABX7PB47_9BACT|nr:hypothetical protein [Pyxidicoccus parkwaysis]QSQ27677.1 hypothetical protein JY651_23425 [Pyxidicoccus parkwaysis]